ncbi:hypothetical protein Tco_0664997 [Tanacetum coccineum]
MDDEPTYAADHVVTLTLGSAITIPETTNGFAIKRNHLTLVKGNQFDGTIKTVPHKHIHEFLRICDIFKYRDTKNEAVCLMMFPLSHTGEAKTWLDKLNEGTIETLIGLKTKTKSSLKKTVAFADEVSGNSDSDRIMARMDAMAMKIDAQYKEFQSRSKQPNPDHNNDDKHISPKEEAKFMQTFHHTRFYNDFRDRDSNHDNWLLSGRNNYNRDKYQSNSDDKPDLQKQLRSKRLLYMIFTGKFFCLKLFYGVQDQNSKHTTK